MKKLKFVIHPLTAAILLFCGCMGTCKISFSQANLDFGVDSITIYDFTGKLKGSGVSAANCVFAPAIPSRPVSLSLTNNSFTFWGGNCVELLPGFMAEVNGTGSFTALVRERLNLAPNEFVIGMFGVDGQHELVVDPSNPDWTDVFPGGNEALPSQLSNSLVDVQCKEFVQSHFDGMGNNTSALNILAADGFTTVQKYGMIECEEISLLQLAQSHGLQVMANHDDMWFKPDDIAVCRGGACEGTLLDGYEPSPCFYGSTDFNNDSESGKGGVYLNTLKPHLNGDKLFQKVYSRQDLSDAVWGYKLTEEASFAHQHNPLTTQHLGFCGQNTCANVPYPPASTDPCSKMIWQEIPPSTVNQAINYFKTQRSAFGIAKQKTLLWRLIILAEY